MPVLTFPGFQTAPYVNVALTTDSIILTPEDLAFSSLVSSSLTTKPNGSSASVTTTSGQTTFAPDLGGFYQVTLSAGAASVVVNFFVVTPTMFGVAGIGTYARGTSTGQTRPVGDRRLLLASLAQNLTQTQMNAWASGTFPQVNLAQFGG